MTVNEGLPTIARCHPLAEKTVLALAAQCWPEAERPAYWRSISDLARSGATDQIVLLAAREANELIAAQVAQALPGRAAIVWPPQFSAACRAKRESIAALLFGRILHELQICGVHLAQALLTSCDQEAENHFGSSGFSRAADLLYLSADVENATGNGLPPPFEFIPVDAVDESRLVRIIERTYVGTLDCPRLDGLRHTADVIAGYRSVGEFRPGLWQIARQDGTDIGCLLVNLHPDVRHAEIVYLGLMPEVRGRGWGLVLARQAQRLAAQANYERVVLAVDAANRPALRLYADAGFSEFDRRAVWIKSLT